MKIKVLIPAHFQADLQPVADETAVQLVPYGPEGDPLADAAGTTALFRWWIPSEKAEALLKRFPTIRWVHTGSAGVDHILTPAFRESGIQLTNSAGVHAVSIAEWVVAAMLAETKGLRRMWRQQEGRVWEKIERPEFDGKRAVIIGAGEIAGQIAKRLRPFGISVTAIRRGHGLDTRFDAVATSADLLPLMAEADWLIVAAPLTADTRGMISRQLLEALPARARVVNVARGEIVDEHALAALISEQRIAGAILDVFSEEPLPPDHAFWSMPEVVVLPHTTWRSPQVRRKQLDLFSMNLRRFVRGEPLVNVVDIEAGY